MKVKELIKLLKELDQNSLVVIRDVSHYYIPVDSAHECELFKASYMGNAMRSTPVDKRYKQIKCVEIW